MGGSSLHGGTDGRHLDMRWLGEGLWPGVSGELSPAPAMGRGLRRRMTPAEHVSHVLRLSGPRGPEIRDASRLGHVHQHLRQPSLEKTLTLLGRSQHIQPQLDFPFNMSSIYKLAAIASN